MLHRYLPHTPEDIAAMLDKCGMKSLDELYSDVPEELLLKRDYDLPDEMSEKEVRDFFRSLADNNRRLTWCRILRPLYSRRSEVGAATVRVSYRLYSLSA